MSAVAVRLAYVHAWSPFGWRAGCVALALAFAVTPPARAQADTIRYSRAYMSTDTIGLQRCRDTAIAPNVGRLTAAQQVVVKDTTPALRPQLDLVSQRIADAARAMLGAAGQRIPSADSLGMLPSGYEPDSVAFRLAVIAYPKGRAFNGERLSLFNVFTTNGIVVVPATVTYHAPIDYPRDANMKRIVGEVLLKFVVDTTGRADISTIRVLRPTAALLDSSEFAPFYREFIEASRTSIERNRYAPAHVGACTVRELVQQPFSYTLRQVSQ